MKYSIEFSKDVLRTLKKWKKSNPISYKKFYSVLEELEEGGFNMQMHRLQS